MTWSSHRFNFEIPKRELVAVLQLVQFPQASVYTFRKSEIVAKRTKFVTPLLVFDPAYTVTAGYLALKVYGNGVVLR